MSFRPVELRKIFFCTGARNHDLLGVWNPENIQFEFDERMASFKALGFAKGKQEPVAVCTTSGTAVSECVSALLEAMYSGVPLVLISGDRPKKMHGTGSPQTVNHDQLTVGSRGSYFELPLSELADLEIKDPVYPIHINVLVDDTKPHDQSVVVQKDISSFAEFLKKIQRPLFLFSHEERSMRPFVLRFANTNLPYYAEAMSGGHDLSLIRTEKKLIELYRKGHFDGVVRIGHTPLSKIWRLLEQSPLPVYSFDGRGLPGLSFGEVMNSTAASLLENPDFWEAVEKVKFHFEGDDSVEALTNQLKKYPESEPAAMKALHDLLPYDGRVYLGNSLIIRFFELIQTKRFRIEGNRGVNGIDGQLATAIGLALSTKETVYCILGDITTRYDLSSLTEMPENLRLIIINNRGGRIFDMLKLDQRIILEHEREFRSIVTGMGISYSQDLKDLKSHQVIELRPDHSQTQKFLAEWL